LVVSVTAVDVFAAERRLRNHAVVTPLLRNARLDELTGGRVLIKAETLQVGGAFKFRGAFNRLVQLDAMQRRAGVVAWSSGNHAQGIAAAGLRLNIAATIVMPADAPAIKIENTRRLGGEIVFYDRRTGDREALGRRLAHERGATLVPAYDDPHVIAGQGTVALEILAQAQELCGGAPDAVLIPCGGGGLSSGCALALEARSPATRVYAVEPVGFDDTARSLASGARQSVEPGAHTICDALMAPTPGSLTFPINARLLAGGLAVSDAAVLAAMRFAWRELKLVVEPGGAVALAALLQGALDCRDQLVAIVLSGGNVDADLLRRSLDAPGE
jgi:threonine dehydratase